MVYVSFGGYYVGEVVGNLYDWKSYFFVLFMILITSWFWAYVVYKIKVLEIGLG